MMNKILSFIIVGAIVVAVVIGLIFRQTYSNVTTEEDFMEKYFSVALWDLDIVPSDYNELMKHHLPNSTSIIRAKITEEVSYTFKSSKQYVEVLDVFKGDELKVGDQIAITSLSWGLVFDNMSSNIGFVNIMQPGDEYLIFLEEEIETLAPEEYHLYSLTESIITPIFNYDDQSNTVIPLKDPNDRYVSYEEVKDNEFMVSSDEALDALMELKHDLLRQYPK